MSGGLGLSIRLARGGLLYGKTHLQDTHPPSLGPILVNTRSASSHAARGKGRGESQWPYLWLLGPLGGLLEEALGLRHCWGLKRDVSGRDIVRGRINSRQEKGVREIAEEGKRGRKGKRHRQ